jgi:putative endonuclease
VKSRKHNQRLGRWGEEQAAAYLAGRGYEIEAANVRTPYGELDLVTRLGDVTVFVEVKARTSRRMGLPEESVHRRKQLHMLSAAQHYAAEHGVDHWQIDVLAVETRAGREPLITHFENAVS